MTGHAEVAIAELTRTYLRDFPLGAAKQLEAMPPSEAAQALADQPVDAIGSLFEAMAPRRRRARRSARRRGCC